MHETKKGHIEKKKEKKSRKRGGVRERKKRQDTGRGRALVTLWQTSKAEGKVIHYKVAAVQTEMNSSPGTKVKEEKCRRHTLPPVLYIMLMWSFNSLTFI